VNDFEQMNADIEAGYVACDDLCKAKDNPKTPEEIEAAYRHWRHHGYLHGCSHAR
jgi:hypothetical protein